MWRGFDGGYPFLESIPEWVALLVALCTQLGDVWFVVLVLTVLYWVDETERDEIAALGGITLAGIGLYRGLKALFGLPRPDRSLLDPAELPLAVQPLYEATATAGGYGFPSGHAVNATVVYVGLATVLSIGTKRRRYAVAAVLVALVSATRLVLGVHYLVDVVAGIAIGLALLFGARALFRRSIVDRGSIGFALGIGFCAFSLVVSAWAVDAALLLAGAVGAFGGWQLVLLSRDDGADSSTSRARRSILLRGAAAVLPATALAVALEGVPARSPSALVGSAALVAAAVVLAPAVGSSAPVRTLYSNDRGADESE